MADIHQQLTVHARPARVFQALSTPEGMSHWWTKSSTGEAREGAEYLLDFGPDFQWRGRIIRYQPNSAFELEITHAHPDWIGSRIGCELQAEGDQATRVRFYHTGWPSENEHWRISCYCWAMYLRILRRYLEHGEEVAYEKRLEV